jgi:hypothetical protein
MRLQKDGCDVGTEEWTSPNDGVGVWRAVNIKIQFYRISPHF